MSVFTRDREQSPGDKLRDYWREKERQEAEAREQQAQRERERLEAEAREREAAEAERLHSWAEAMELLRRELANAEAARDHFAGRGADLSTVGSAIISCEVRAHRQAAEEIVTYARARVEDHEKRRATWG